MLAFFVVFFVEDNTYLIQVSSCLSFSPIFSDMILFIRPFLFLLPTSVISSLSSFFYCFSFNLKFSLPSLVLISVVFFCFFHQPQCFTALVHMGDSCQSALDFGLPCIQRYISCLDNINIWFLIQALLVLCSYTVICGAVSLNFVSVCLMSVSTLLLWHISCHLTYSCHGSY